MLIYWQCRFSVLHKYSNLLLIYYY